jgi:hypothetical protein
VRVTNESQTVQWAAHGTKFSADDIEDFGDSYAAALKAVEHQGDELKTDVSF